MTAKEDITRPLGKTGMHVSPIAFGAFKIGRNQNIKYEQSYALPDDKQVSRIIQCCHEQGVNYIDTAPAYGISEERLGKLLPMPLRQEFIISTKVGEFFADNVSTYRFDHASVESSLDISRRRLNLGTLDLVFTHVNLKDLEIQKNTDVVSVLAHQKEQGRIKAIGHSAKTVEGAAYALTWADVLMLEYNVDNREMLDVMVEAKKRGIGVVVKKGLASGFLDPQEAIDFVFQDELVDSLIVGTMNETHLAQNHAYALEALMRG